MTTTHFGYQEIPAQEKASRVRGVFDAVASRYDVMNDAMSGGLHRLWKREMVAKLAIHKNMRVLDVAGGTGDIAFRIVEDARWDAASSEITICDINHAMLSEGRKRAMDKNLLGKVEIACGDAQSLPFPDGSFDAYTIAFGMRNVTDIPLALSEAKRVLKPGGQFLCLEFSHVEMPILKNIYDAYSFHLIPRMGQAIAGDAAPYQYLVESIRRFPNQERYAEMLREAGFARTGYRNMTGGVVALHHGWVV